MSKQVELSRDEAEGLTEAVEFYIKHGPDDRAKQFAANGALEIAQAFGMNEEYQQEFML